MVRPNKSHQWWIDWADPHFPQIRHARAGDEWMQLMTFGQCKREIIDHFTTQITDARHMIAQTRALRVKDMEDE